MPATTTSKQAPSASTLKTALAAAGVDTSAANARRQRNGVYVFTFHDPDAANFRSLGTDPARVWADRITAALPGVEIVDTYDSIHRVRPVAPVLAALVFVRLETKETRTFAQAS